MIQPRTYPELLAKALMLEPEPFAVMTHDDQPIIEGLVLTALVGVGVGVARTIGGLLFSWAMPPAAALEAAQLAMEIAGPAAAAGGSVIEKIFRDIKAMDIVEGTGQVQRMVIARDLVQLPR